MYGGVKAEKEGRGGQGREKEENDNTDDAGMAREETDKETKKNSAEREHKSVTGKGRYMSSKTHRGKGMARKMPNADPPDL